MTLADVFLRYVFNSPIRGAYELVEAMLVVFVFHGMSTAFLQRRNIVIDLIDSFAHRFIVAALIRIADVLTVVDAGDVRLRHDHAGDAVLQLRRSQNGAASADLVVLGRRASSASPAPSCARSAR